MRTADLLRSLLPTAAVVIGLLASISGSLACSSYPDKMETLVIATTPTDINAPYYVAEAQGFFTANGLKVNLKEDYDAGATATAGMLKGDADVSTASEFLMMRQILNKKDLVNFGTVTKYENTYVAWRADSGIKTLKDLKGRKVGLPLQTIVEFYVGRALELNGVQIQQVSLVDVRAPDAEKALAGREVDAVVSWEPYPSQIGQRMGSDVIISPIQSGQYAYWNLVCKPDWVKAHPEALQRLLKSLLQTEGYIVSHQEEAKAIVEKRMKLDAGYMRVVWPRYQFSLSLEQSLITAMEDETRWMIVNKLTTEVKVPDFVHYVYEDTLKALNPEAVDIIR